MNEEKAISMVRELLDSELGDYSVFSDKGIEISESDKDNDIYWFSVKINKYDEFYRELQFKVEDDELHIEMGEDTYEELNDYNYKVKYFWMALLSWN